MQGDHESLGVEPEGFEPAVAGNPNQVSSIGIGALVHNLALAGDSRGLTQTTPRGGRAPKPHDH